MASASHGQRGALISARRPWPALLYAALPFALGAAYEAWAVARFGYHGVDAAKHALPVLAWCLASLAVLGWIGRLRDPWRIAAAGALLSLSVSCLALIYAASVISNTFWGDNMTARVFLRFLPEYRELCLLASVKPSAALAALGLAWAAFLLAALWAARGLLALSQDPGARRLCGWPLLALLCLIAFDNGVAYTRFWEDDPVIDFFGSSPRSRLMDPSIIAATRQEDEDRASVGRELPARRTVLLFIVDALRPDRLPLYGHQRPLTPHLDRLFRRWPPQWAPQALALAPESKGGILTILSSKPQARHQDFNYTLPDALADQGFRSRLILSGDHHWYNFRDSYGKRIFQYVDGGSPGLSKGINDDQRLVEAVRALAPSDGTPEFFYFHLMSVHDSSALKEGHRIYMPTLNPAAVAFRKAPVTAAERAAMTNLYDDRIHQADEVIGALMEELGKKGYLSSFVACLVADHGESLGERGQYGHGKQAYQELLWVPLVFWGSGLPRMKGLELADQRDVAPTLMDLAGLPAPRHWAGRSLLRPAPAGPRVSVHYDAFNRISFGAVALRDQGSFLKYIRPLWRAWEGHEEVYDVRADPKELHNLAYERPELTMRLRPLADQGLPK